MDSSLSGEERMTFEILIRAPVPGPAGMYENGLSRNFDSLECSRRDRTSIFLCMEDNSLQVREGLQGKLRKIDPIREAVKGTVHVRAGIGDHFDFADMKLCSFGVILSRSFPRKKITDDR